MHPTLLRFRIRCHSGSLVDLQRLEEIPFDNLQQEGSDFYREVQMTFQRLEELGSYVANFYTTIDGSYLYHVN